MQTEIQIPEITDHNLTVGHLLVFETVKNQCKADKRLTYIQHKMTKYQFTDENQVS
jgi:hypothetical protein